MTPNARTSLETSAGEVMASVDETASGKQLVIADITRDDAFLTVAFEDALALSNWE